MQSVSARLVPYPEIETDAVFALDEDAMLSTEEVDTVCSMVTVPLVTLFQGNE